MILFLSNADTELLALGSIVHRLPDGFPAVRAANPGRLDAAPDLDGVTAVVVRLLGGRTAWEPAFDELRTACVAAEIPLVALGGEAEPDVELTRLSTVPAGTAREAHRYLAAGGPPNVEHLLRFVADTVLLGRLRLRSAPAAAAHRGVDGAGLGVPGARRDTERPLVGVVFYRAHLVAGNTQFVADLCRAIEGAGGDAWPCRATRCGPDADGRVEALELLAATGRRAGRRRCWPWGRVAGRDVRTTRATTGGADARRPGRAGHPGPLPATGPATTGPTTRRGCAARRRLGVAIPEFDGRIIGPAFAFKEEVDDGGRPRRAGASPSRTDPERARRGWPALAVRHARLRRIPPADKRVAVVLSAYPTKRSRLGNAVGLDTPGLRVELLHALRDAGYRVDRIPRRRRRPHGRAGRRVDLRRRALTAEQLATAPLAPRRSTDYAGWFATLPADARPERGATWGPAPGELYVARRRPRVQRHRPRRTCSSRSSRRGATATIRSPCTTRPDLPPPHHYLGLLPLARRGVGRRRDRPPRQARHARVAARQGDGPVGRLLPRRRARRRAVLLPVRRQRPRRGHAGQAAHARRRSSTTCSRR